MVRVIALLAAFGGALLWAGLALLPPPPQGADAPPATFSATRAFTDIEEIARAPHPTGSAENARVRGYLIERMNALGAEVTDQAFPLPREIGRAAQQLARARGSRCHRP